MSVVFEHLGVEYEVEGWYDAGTPDSFEGHGNDPELKVECIYYGEVDLEGAAMEPLINDSAWWDAAMAAFKEASEEPDDFDYE